VVESPHVFKMKGCVAWICCSWLTPEECSSN